MKLGRVIRLKEWGSNTRTFKRPSEKQFQVATSALKDKSFPLNTDKNGFIINSYTENELERKKTLVLLGDSFVESLFVDEELRINSIVEKFLKDFRVLNGGYSGATSLHILNIIINKVIPLNPDYVVFFLPTNDQRVQRLDNGYWNSDARLSPLVPLRKGDELVDDYPMMSNSKSVYKLLEVIHLMLESFSIPHCFATTPHRTDVTSEDEWVKKAKINIKHFSEKVRQRKAVNNTCREFCLKEGLNCIDLENDPVIVNDFFYDDLHLTNQSSPVVGKIIFERLKSWEVFRRC